MNAKRPKRNVAIGLVLSLRDRLAERANDVDWLLWVDRADDVKRPFGFPVAERQGYILRLCYIFNQPRASLDMASSLWPLQVFDPNAEVSIVERKLPHWSQAGTVCFITWRTIDSIPKSVLNRWHADREVWLRRHGIESRASDWKSQVQQLPPMLRAGWHSLLQAV